jgi:hypothetical protein
MSFLIAPSTGSNCVNCLFQPLTPIPPIADNHRLLRSRRKASGRYPPSNISHIVAMPEGGRFAILPEVAIFPFLYLSDDWPQRCLCRLGGILHGVL